MMPQHVKNKKSRHLTMCRATVNRLGWLGEAANFKEKTQRAAFMSRHKGKNIKRDKGRCTRFKYLYKIILQICVFYRVYLKFLDPVTEIATVG